MKNFNYSEGSKGPNGKQSMGFVDKKPPVWNLVFITWLGKFPKLSVSWLPNLYRGQK